MSRKIEMTDERVNSRIVTDVIVFVPPTGNTIKDPVVAKALWDTGATHSQVSREVATMLGLKCVGERPVNHGMGRSNVRFYEAGMMIGDVMNVRKMYVGECMPTEYYHAIIGMDLISFGRFTIEGEGENRTFRFEVP